MTAIDAPYNFVPLSDKVVTPEWATQVSHDVPFKDGVSGEIHYTLTAHSPLLVGGVQRKATAQAPGEVHFFKTPDGYAIPGSSLKGMIREVAPPFKTEIAARISGSLHGLSHRRERQ